MILSGSDLPVFQNATWWVWLRHKEARDSHRTCRQYVLTPKLTCRTIFHLRRTHCTTLLP